MNKKERLIQETNNRLPDNLKYTNVKYNYYLWLCLVQKWLFENDIPCYVEPLGPNKFGANCLSYSEDLTGVSYKQDDVFTNYKDALEDAVLGCFVEE